MSEKLNNLIQKIKSALETDPDGPIIGKINPGKVFDNQILSEGNKDYYEFLAVSNGARCGSIDIFSFETMSKNEYYVDFIEDIADSQLEWSYIGQCVYEPILLNRLDGLVYQFFEGPPLEKGECYGTFDEFITNYVFGEKYNDIVPDAKNDEWYKLLLRLQIV